MDSVVLALEKMVDPISKSEFAIYHSRTHEDTNQAAKRFLHSTNDEVRLRRADEYADFALAIVDMEETTYFRRAVLRRELIADIDYQKQRDHAAHTLYNYLLVWYIFSNNEAMRQEIQRHFILRLASRRATMPPLEIANRFGNIWPFVSLLHDIGYIFEGSLSPMSTDTQNERVRRGAAVVHDYFHHRFWSDTQLDSVTVRALLVKKANMTIPDFELNSIAATGDQLCTIGSVEIIRAAARNELDKFGMRVSPILTKANGLSGDAFDLWMAHYAAYDLAGMVDRIKYMRAAYKALIWNGMPGIGVRLLDHGVCSGLLMLLHSTFFYRLYFGIGDDEPSDPLEKQLWHFIKHESVPEGVVYDAHWWWTGILWGTAAAALHNIQQLPNPLHGLREPIPALHLEEDPITYLGILVDIVQEWDRYSVIPERRLLGNLPLQGTDVDLGFDHGLLVINYHDSDCADVVKKSLDRALDSWTKIMRIEG